MGRAPASLTISLYGLPSDAERIRPFLEMGVSRGIFSLPAADRETVLPLIDRCASVAAELRR